ncbi:hypothetical protein H6790_02980 [Candidatus Nomurabacteria bacterium]|nr:hypothetical protein [Candidatus Nomurabacteria bacterium]MCB9820882.1 hypothetical protein [Candidatus Nomurabacteria bacterium]
MKTFTNMNAKNLFWGGVIILALVITFSTGGILLSRDIYVSVMTDVSNRKIPPAPQIIGFMLAMSVVSCIVFDFIKNGKKILWALTASIVMLLIWKFFPVQFTKDIVGGNTFLIWVVGVIVSLLFGKLVYEMSKTPAQ